MKAILITLVLAALVYVGIKVIPLLINDYQFQDGLQNIARFASVNKTSPDVVKKTVLDEAQKDDIPIQAENIKVQTVGRTLGISVEYSVTVDLMAYQWTLNFHPAASNQAMF